MPKDAVVVAADARLVKIGTAMGTALFGVVRGDAHRRDRMWNRRNGTSVPDYSLEDDHHCDTIPAPSLLHSCVCRHRRTCSSNCC